MLRHFSLWLFFILLFYETGGSIGGGAGGESMVRKEMCEWWKAGALYTLKVTVCESDKLWRRHGTLMSRSLRQAPSHCQAFEWLSKQFIQYLSIFFRLTSAFYFTNVIRKKQNHKGTSCGYSFSHTYNRDIHSFKANTETHYSHSPLWAI